MKRSKLLYPYAIIMSLLILIFARLTLDARKLSLTTDEPFHIASGYAYLASGTTWTTTLRGHPLLVDAWCALPLFIGEPDIPIKQLNGWGEDHVAYLKSFVPYISEDIERYEFATRVPSMLLTLLLAAIVTRWGLDLCGLTGGLGGLLVLILDPLLLGHGMLATNDVGVTALGTLALYLTYRLGQEKASTSRVVITGLTYGLTMLAKSSGIIWIAGGLMMLGLLHLRQSSRKKVAQVWIGQCAAILSIAILAIWAFYRFEWGPLRISPISVPAPTHWESILLQAESPTRRNIYYLGRVESQGWWLYFPLAFLLKNPIPFLLMLGWSLVAFAKSKHHTRNLALIVFPFVYAITAIASGLNIGYRHLLPIHPFLYLSIGGVLKNKNRTRFAWIGLLTWLGLESFVIAPHHIAYFNQLAGGPNQGWRYLADSNTDWGQAHKALHDYQEKTGRSFSYSGKALYAGYSLYGIEAHPLPPLPESHAPTMEPWIRPTSGYYVISANSLAGLGCTQLDNYAWFRYHQPEEVIGHVLFIYYVPPIPGKTWVAQCLTPTTPLDDNALSRGFPIVPSRKIAFDCTQSWIIPQSSSERGWYVLHDEMIDRRFETLQRIGLKQIEPSHSFAAKRTQGLDLSYRQWNYRKTPAYAVYTPPSAPPFGTPAVTQGFIGAAETPPELFSGPKRGPISVGSSITFLGIETHPYRDGLDIATWWLVDVQPSARPASIMAHLLTEQGTALAIADGLGVAIENWRPGDILIQHHRFKLETKTPDLWLRTGVYWLDSGERWSVRENQEDAIFIKLPNR